MARDGRALRLKSHYVDDRLQEWIASSDSLLRPILLYFPFPLIMCDEPSKYEFCTISSSGCSFSS